MDGVKQGPRQRAAKPAMKNEQPAKNISGTAGTGGQPKSAGRTGRRQSGLIAAIVFALAAVIAVYGWQNADKAELKKNLEQSIQNKEKEFNLKLNEFMQDVNSLKEAKQSLEDEKTRLEGELQDIKAGAMSQFKNEKLGVSFAYPAIYGKAEFKETDGEKGKLFAVTFAENDKLLIGGISADFEAGREGAFSDSQGYIEKGGKYFFKFVSTKPDDSYPLQPVKIIDVSGGQVLIVDKASFTSERGSEGPLLNPGDNSLGALVNLKAGSYPGMAFWNKDASSTPIGKFEEMLKTIQIK